MSLFSDIPIRTNSNTDVVFASWWNTIRSKLIQFAGGGVTEEAEFTVADNQSSYADITGLSFDGATYGHVEIKYSIYRFDAASDERKESGKLIIDYKKDAATWVLSRRSNNDDALNIASSIIVSTTAGVAQIRYKSDSMGGTYEGTMIHKVISTLNVES